MSEFIPSQKTNECSICLEPIGNKNNCVTPCGHTFCFECMSKSLTKSNCCPCCRTILMEVPENEYENEYDNEYNFDSEEISYEEYETNDIDNTEELTERFSKQGYTLLDAMCILSGKWKKLHNPKYTLEYIEDMVDNFEEMLYEIDREYEERIQFASHDNRI